MTLTIATLKRFLEIVLVLSLIGDIFADHCAKEHGPYFRCVISGSCSFENQTSGPKKCGKGEIGICCRIISNISPQRCGIRYPGILDDNFMVRSQFRQEEVSVSNTETEFASEMLETTTSNANISEQTNVDSSESTNMDSSQPLTDIVSLSEVSTEEDATTTLSNPYHFTTSTATLPTDDFRTETTATVESDRRKREILDINQQPMISKRFYDEKSKSFEENRTKNKIFVKNVDASDHNSFQSDFNQLFQSNSLKENASGIVSRRKREFDWNCSPEDLTSIVAPKITPEEIFKENYEESDNLDSRSKVFSPQFIIGGRIENEPWPWIVAIYYEPTRRFICAGTLFDDRHIISAAHCFDHSKYLEPSRIVVTIGHLKRTDMETEVSNPDKVQLYQVKQIFQHEGFLTHCFCNDVSILRLASPVGPDIIPACIAEKMPAKVGQTVTTMGWGNTVYGSTKSTGIRGSYELQRIDGLIIFDSKQCRKILSKVSGVRMPKNFADYYICVGVPNGEKDTCAGDSGGPLMFEDYDGYWSLVGVVSFGYKCGIPGIPATYSKISYYLPWILNVTKTV